ncbi:MAG TPA: hypothetical protein VFO44_13140 [Steroidobacteraceae bacterium]|nr:hypothetical protein [Steroidobacteraceae bacterium]
MTHELTGSLQTNTSTEGRAVKRSARIACVGQRHGARLAPWLLTALAGALAMPAGEAAPSPTSNPSESAASTSAAPVPPYAHSKVILGMSWDLSTVTSLRTANGSDLWPMTWGSDGELYGAWGDGGGFDGDSDSAGRVGLGFARISGVPVAGSVGSYSGQNIWGAAPNYAQSPATFGGKVGDLISVHGVLYAHGGLWTASNCDCSDPIHKPGDNSTERTLAWSRDLGKSWQIAPWTTSRDLGASLQFGRDYSGAWDPAHVYLYTQGDRFDDPGHLYLRRVALGSLTADPATAGHYQYWAGVDSNGTPQWSNNASTGRPIFSDPNVKPGTWANAAVVYDAPLGRYLLTTFHGTRTGQVGFFEAPNPWGPWATIAYYADWGGYNESGGEANGLSFPSKWISADGRSLWGVFSGAGAFDAFNVAGVQFATAPGIPEFLAPVHDTVLKSGDTVNLRGAGTTLAWSVTLVKEGGPPIARGTGASLSFVVPSNVVADEIVRVRLTGPGSSLYRDFRIATSALPALTLKGVSSDPVAPGSATP